MGYTKQFMQIDEVRVTGNYIMYLEKVKASIQRKCFSRALLLCLLKRLSFQRFFFLLL